MERTKGLIVVLSVLVLAIALVEGQSPYSGQEFQSNIFRSSPFGQCDFNGSLWTPYLRDSQLPCISQNVYNFLNYTSQNLTVPQIASILAIVVQNVRYVYIGNTIDRIQILSPTAPGPFNNTGNIIQTFSTGLKSGGNWVASFSDSGSYVAFINTAGELIKYALLGYGTLALDENATLSTGVANVASVIQLSSNIFVLAGSTSIIQFDIYSLNISKVLAVPTTPAGSVGSIVCGVCADPECQFIYYSGSTGVIFSYSTVTNIVQTSISTGTPLSGACAAYPGSYGLFVTKNTPASILQYSYSSINGLGSQEFIVDGVGIAGQSISPSVTNLNGSAFYFLTYTAGGSTAQPDSIYEFRLYDDTFDFSTIIQNFYQAGVNSLFINPNVLSTPISNINTGSTAVSIYIGASGTQNPGVYELLVAPYFPAPNPNITTVNHLVPDFSLPANPSGVDGKLNSIADTGFTYTNGDITFGNGLGYFPTINNTAVYIPSRGAQVTYIRGTLSESAHGATINVAGMSLKLVSLDEVTAGAGNNSVQLFRSIPFFDSNDVPWYHDTAFDQTVNGPNGGVTGVSWIAGVTNDYTIASHQYPYLLTPYARVLNNTVPVPPGNKVNKKRAATQFTPGYLSYSLTLSTYNTNQTTDTIMGIPYNVSSRYFKYQFSVTNFPLTYPHILRLTVAVGLGADGNTSLGAFQLGANSTVAPIIPGVILATPHSDWTLLLPQKALIQPSTIVAAPYANTYDPGSQLISLYMPYAPANSTLTTTILIEYTYVSGPAVGSNVIDGGGPKLLPLWIVIGVVGGLVIIAIIVAIIVIIIIYKVAGDKIKAFIEDREMDRTKGVLDEHRSPF